MELAYFHVQAFADRMFAGNPAGVCLLDKPLPPELLQAMAAEHRLSETAFVDCRFSPPRIRWFTPSTEVDLCGHATLASAWVWLSYIQPLEKEIQFASAAGTLTARRDEDRVVIELPSRPAGTCEPAERQAVCEALGVDAREVLKARDYLVVLDDAQAVQCVRPDMEALGKLPATGVIVTARGDDCDFVSRFFAPAVGVPEDPVTGSAHCSLVPFWSRVLSRQWLLARQLSSRGGTLWCENLGDRISVAGRCLLYSQGTIVLPDELGEVPPLDPEQGDATTRG
jgi:PhzF family phenazine biosynthesis protein